MNIHTNGKISVVIPTYNRKKSLAQCLDSLLNQDYPEDKIEAIVVDDSSNAEIEIMLEDLKKKHPNLKYLSQDRKGPASARNLGIKFSTGEVVCFIDDDCIADKQWIRRIAETHQNNPGIIAVGGITLTATQHTPVIVGQFLSNYSIETKINGKKEVIFFPTCNVSVKRWVFDTHKFNENFPLPGGEDLEFFWRLFKNDYRFLWDREIEVIHNRQGGFTHFVRQAYNYGRGNLLVKYMHKEQPLLKELKTDTFSFWVATLINIIKLPRFSYVLGKRLIKDNKIKQVYKSSSVYAYFLLHKISYIAGNIREYFRLRKKTVQKGKQLPFIPELLILDITHSCNLCCRICDIWETAVAENDIDISYIKSILLQSKNLGIKEITLSGGEPLFRKDIFEILDYAKKLEIKNLGVLTNGILVGIYKERLKPYILDNTISLVISFDSLRPDTHNNIRNSDNAWQQTQESLQFLSSLKNSYPHINFNIITIILNQNLEELLNLANFVKSLSANSLQFQALLPNNLRMAERKNSLSWVSSDRLEVLDKTIDELIEFKKENQIFLRNSSNNLSLIKKYYRGTINSRDVRCLSAYRTILISNQGECCTCFSSYGDIKSEDFTKILQSEKIIKARTMTNNCRWPCLLPCFCD